MPGHIDLFANEGLTTPPRPNCVDRKLNCLFDYDTELLLRLRVCVCVRVCVGRHVCSVCDFN